MWRPDQWADHSGRGRWRWCRFATDLLTLLQDQTRAFEAFRVDDRENGIGFIPDFFHCLTSSLIPSAQYVRNAITMTVGFTFY
jgi:hypothetical protein